MTDRINGAVRAGEFLSGNMDFFSFATIVPLGQTNVNTPVVDLNTYQTYLNLGIWTAVTVIDGSGAAQTYTTLNQYLDAFYKQRNLDTLISTFSSRANPVAVSVKIMPSTIMGISVNTHTSTIFAEMGYKNTVTNSVFGSADAGTGYTIYIVNIASEKTLLWNAGTVNGNFNGTPADDTNLNGYHVLSSNSLYGGLDGLKCYDLQSGSVLDASTTSSTDYYAIKNTVSPHVATWNASSSTDCNIMAQQGFDLQGSLLS
jgi:hypothetical protein